MSTYFVTGATGFIGRRLVERLLRRAACERVFVLVRPQSADRVTHHDRVTVVPGDLTSRLEADAVDHVVHLGAVSDFTADEDEQTAVNVGGTKRVPEYAARTGCGLVHHVSSIAVAGDFRLNWPSLPLPRAPTGVLAEPGIPPQVVPHLAAHTEFDSTGTRTVTGLEPPEFRTYTHVLRRYWAEHLDPLRAYLGSKSALDAFSRVAAAVTRLALRAVR